MKNLGKTTTVSLVVGLLLVVLNHLSVYKGNSLKSKVLLRDICWSFAEPIPTSPANLIEAAEKYAFQIECQFDKRKLTTLSPFTMVDLEYKYSIQKPNGSWEYVAIVVSVGDGIHLLSYAEILWELHVAAHKHLENKDNHYFEGLIRKEKEINHGVPAYEVYLGS
jgi:hypothetical protein